MKPIRWSGRWSLAGILVAATLLVAGTTTGGFGLQKVAGEGGFAIDGSSLTRAETTTTTTSVAEQAALEIEGLATTTVVGLSAEVEPDEADPTSTTTDETDDASSTTSTPSETTAESTSESTPKSTIENAAALADSGPTGSAESSRQTDKSKKGKPTSTTKPDKPGRNKQTTTTSSSTTASTTATTSATTASTTATTSATTASTTATTSATTASTTSTTTATTSTTASTTTSTTTSSGSGTVYYVDCSGSDNNNGTSTNRAVRTLGRASGLALAPGDQLLLKRGCSWSGGQRLNAGWNGTSSKPITIGTYGSGAKPRIVDGLNQGVKVTGSHMVIQDIHVTFNVSATKTLNGCTQPFGDYYGVNFTEGANNVRLTGSLLEKANAGVHISAASHHITVQGNVFQKNNVMNVFGGNPSADLGAWGVLLRSDNNVVSHNQFTDNKAVCKNGAGRIHSNSVEIFEGTRNYIHHNRSNDRVFSELGGSSSQKAADNRFEFNLHQSGMVDARFITTRGGGSGWGPVYRTVVEHNTVNLTGSGSVAISCGEGCNSNILRLRGNILIGADKPLFADANFDEADNVYWHPGGETRIQIASSNKLYSPGTAVLNGSIVANPQLGSGQKPGSSSPAVNRADSSAPWAGSDLAGNGPNGTRDSGAFEVG